MSGRARTTSPPRPTFAFSLTLGVFTVSTAALGACGGRDAPDDAPALLGSAIPPAAQGAVGAPVGTVAPPPGAGATPRQSQPRLPEDLPIPEDPFGGPEALPPPAGGTTQPKGMPL